MATSSAPGARVPRSGFFDPAATDRAARRAGRRWLAVLAIALLLTACLIVSVGYLLYDGIEIWGNNIPVVWALDIISYDWWMGIACGAMLVAAVHRLAFGHGRDTIGRMAETMALFTAAAAAIYPIIHLGRPWFFYWNLPYPNSLGLWPQFRSPLFWDAVDILSFLTVSLLLWYLGMLPDLAAARDGAKALRARRIWGVAALGWRGEAAHWVWWQDATRTLAMLGILIAILVQCGASVMYAGSLEPGWHDTLLPVIFIAGAALSGLGAVAVGLGLRRFLWPSAPALDGRDHDRLGLALAAVGLAAIYCYGFDLFFTALGGDHYDRLLLMRRVTGASGWGWWLIVPGALVAPQLLWRRAFRRSPRVLTFVGALAVIGIWGDHAMTLITTLQHDFLPSSAHHWRPTGWAIGTFAGTIGLFLLLLLAGLRWLPRLAARAETASAPVSDHG